MFVAIQSLLRHHLGKLRVGPGDFSRHGEAHFWLVKQFDGYVGVTWRLRVLGVLTDDLLWKQNTALYRVLDHRVWMHMSKMALSQDSLFGFWRYRRHWSCDWRARTPSWTDSSACPAASRCWTSPPQSASGDCCTPLWISRPTPEPVPGPPSADLPEASFQNNLHKRAMLNAGFVEPGPSALELWRTEGCFTFIRNGTLQTVWFSWCRVSLAFERINCLLLLTSVAR